MTPPAPALDPAALDAFVGLCGRAAFRARIAALARPAAGARTGRAMQQHHAIELTLARLVADPGRTAGAADAAIGAIAAYLAELHDRLRPAGRVKLRAQLGQGLRCRAGLTTPFHLARTAALQERRGFAVEFAGLEEDAPFDLLLARGGAEAELACEAVSADDGRDLHRSAWFDLVDGIDPDLQTWLSSHPGRYLLKMTLPQGLRADDAIDQGGTARLAELQRRIRGMLASHTRSDQDEAAVLRLDPLLVAGAQAGEMGLMDAMREQFGPEAQLAVTRAGKAVFVMAARAGRESDIGAALGRRLHAATPARFTGARPGILSVFLEDADRGQWRALRDGLLLEGQTRQFLTTQAASVLVAVTACSRTELFGIGGADAAVDGELRFRNQAHAAARSTALAPAISSSF